MNVELQPHDTTPEGSRDDPPGAASSPPDRDARPGTTPNTRGRWRTVLPWLLVVLLTATSVSATVAWRLAADKEATRDAVRSAVTGLAIDLVTWESGTLDETADQLRARGTGEFLDQVDDVIGAAKELTAAVEGSSSGEVLDLLVDVDAGRAVAVVIVRQTLRAAGAETSDEQVMRVELVDVDGAWLVDEVELINVPVPIAFGQEPS